MKVFSFENDEHTASPNSMKYQHVGRNPDNTENLDIDNNTINSVHLRASFK